MLLPVNPKPTLSQECSMACPARPPVGPSIVKVMQVSRASWTLTIVVRAFNALWISVLSCFQFRYMMDEHGTFPLLASSSTSLSALKVTCHRRANLFPRTRSRNGKEKFPRDLLPWLVIRFPPLPIVPV